MDITKQSDWKTLQNKHHNNNNNNNNKSHA